ncbi:MAG TPA: hypothetical protein VJH33_01590 [Candidatus Paceibacterota bacterium]
MRTLLFENQHALELRRCFNRRDSGYRPIFSTIRFHKLPAHEFDPGEEVRIAVQRANADLEVVGFALVVATEKRAFYNISREHNGIMSNVGPKTREELFDNLTSKNIELSRAECQYLTVSIITLEQK